MRRWGLGIAIVASACGAPPPAADGGPADGADDVRPVEPVRDCDLSLETGTRCARFDFCADYVGDGYCARRVVRCIGGYVAAANDTTIVRDVACTADEVAIEVSGPGGALTLDRAAAALTSGFTQSAELLFSGGDPYWSCGTPRLVVRGLVPGIDGEYAATFAVGATLYVESGEHELTGTVEISAGAHYDSPAVLSGTLSLTGGGYTVTGPFTATDCGALGGTSL